MSIKKNNNNKYNKDNDNNNSNNNYNHNSDKKTWRAPVWPENGGVRIHLPEFSPRHPQQNIKNKEKKRQPSALEFLALIPKAYPFFFLQHKVTKALLLPVNEWLKSTIA